MLLLYSSLQWVLKHRDNSACLYFNIEVIATHLVQERRNLFGISTCVSVSVKGVQCGDRAAAAASERADLRFSRRFLMVFEYNNKKTVR